MGTSPLPLSVTSADPFLLSPLPPSPVNLLSSSSLSDVPSSNVGVFEPDSGLVSLPSMPQLPFATTSALPPLDYNASQQLGSVSDLILHQRQLSTPTMHPNLVSTLKSIISPSSTSQPLHQQLELQQQEQAALAEALSEHYESKCSNQASISRGVDDPASALALQELQTMYTVASCKQQPDDQSQAAIVPVDWIQNRRPFRCDFPSCNKTFKNPQTLKMHHKTHYSEDSAYRKGGVHSLATFPPSCKAGHNKKIPSKCPICKRTFVGLYELRRHFGRKHSEGEKSHGCKKCGKKFYIEVDLRDHEKLCGEPLECKCGMKFAFKCNLVAHKKTHPDCQDWSEEGGATSARCASSPAPHHHHRPAAAAFLPLSQPPATCALGANFHSPSLLKPFSRETFNLASAPRILRPDVKSEEGAFPRFASAILGVGPMV